jgi:hypothetical protein
VISAEPVDNFALKLLGFWALTGKKQENAFLVKKPLAGIGNSP